MKMTANRKASCTGSAKVLLCLLVLAVVGVIGCIILTSTPPPPGPLELVSEDKSTIASVRALWEYERDYSLRKKAFADSITELGDGSELGRDGFCLRWYVWRARYEASDRVADASRDDHIGYFYRLMPQADANGRKNPFSVVLAAIPEKDSDPAFVALCGPVDLSDDFTFNKTWKLYKFVSATNLLNILKSREMVSSDEIISNLPNCVGGLDATRCLDIVGGLFPTNFYGK